MTPLPYWSFLNTKTEKSTIKNNELDDFKNPTPNSNKMELNTLPVLDNVFFVHYTCGNFNEYRNPAETPITGLFLYDRQSRDFVPNEEKDELRCILEYLGCFNDNQGNGLTPVHWGQKKSYWGFAHLIKRVSFLTKKLSNGEVTPLYTPDFPHDTIDLSEYLFNRYGDKYIEHPRLDNLASLNGFNGIRETNPTNITYSGSTRLMLLVKIYEAERTGELKTRPTTTQQNIGEKSEQAKKFIAKEIALAYVIDLYADGKHIPKNPIDGSVVKRTVEMIGEQKGLLGNTFYKAVLSVLSNDLNTIRGLNNISKRWLEVLRKLTSDLTKLNTYLINKKLIEREE